MNTGIWIVRDVYGRFFMNTLSGVTKRIISLPYSQGDGQISGFTFTEEEKERFLSRISNDYNIFEDDVMVHQVYFNKNNTMIIITNNTGV